MKKDKTDRMILEDVFKAFGVETKKAEGFLYAAGRRFEFDPEGCIEKIVDYGTWRKGDAT